MDIVLGTTYMPVWIRHIMFKWGNTIVWAWIGETIKEYGETSGKYEGCWEYWAININMWWNVNDQKMTRNMSCTTIDPVFMDDSMGAVHYYLGLLLLRKDRSLSLITDEHTFMCECGDHLSLGHPCPCHEHGMPYAPHVWKHASPSPSLSMTWRDNEINLAVRFLSR